MGKGTLVLEAMLLSLVTSCSHVEKPSVVESLRFKRTVKFAVIPLSFGLYTFAEVGEKDEIFGSENFFVYCSFKERKCYPVIHFLELENYYFELPIVRAITGYKPFLK